MLRLCAPLLTAWFASLCQAPLADDVKETPKRPIRLSLKVVEKVVKTGVVPEFKLILRNEGTAAEQVIDLTGGRRPDLQHTYYQLEVVQQGKAVVLPRSVSDPGPIADQNFLELEAGKKVAFKLRRFALALGKLPPGEYQARIRFWQDPLQPAQTAYFSPYAEFTVQE
jgi:hypothetical protein